MKPLSSKLSISLFSCAKNFCVILNQKLMEVTGSYGKLREVMGSYGKLWDVMGSYEILREVTGDNRNLWEVLGSYEK